MAWDAGLWIFWQGYHIWMPHTCLADLHGLLQLRQTQKELDKAGKRLAAQQEEIDLLRSEAEQLAADNRDLREAAERSASREKVPALLPLTESLTPRSPAVMAVVLHVCALLLFSVASRLLGSEFGDIVANRANIQSRRPLTTAQQQCIISFQA